MKITNKMATPKSPIMVDEEDMEMPEEEMNSEESSEIPEEESSENTITARQVVSLADNILYDKKGIQMIKNFFANSKDIATGAAFIVTMLLFKLRDQIEDLDDDALFGQDAAAAQVLDAVFEIAQKLNIPGADNPQAFRDAFNMIEETYEDAMGTQESPEEEAMEPNHQMGKKGLLAGSMRG